MPRPGRAGLDDGVSVSARFFELNECAVHNVNGATSAAAAAASVHTLRSRRRRRAKVALPAIHNVLSAPTNSPADRYSSQGYRRERRLLAVPVVGTGPRGSLCGGGGGLGSRQCSHADKTNEPLVDDFSSVEFLPHRR